MADPMRIRAQASGDKATVRVLMSHEMESGQRKDGNGKTIPAWHIQNITASLNGKPVMTAEWGPAVSKNPFLQFNIKGAKAGDKVTITGPDIAENGAVVPLGVSTSLPNAKRLLLLVEKNPSAMVAMFNVSPEVDANFATRSKMGQSSDVYAVAITNDGKAFFAKKEVKVTLGGCGG